MKLRFSLGSALKNRSGAAVLTIANGMNVQGTPDPSMGVYLKSFNLKKYTQLSGDNYEVNMIATLAHANNNQEQKSPVEINFNVYAPGKIIQRCYKMVDGLSKDGQNIKIEGEWENGITGNVIIGSDGAKITVSPTLSEIDIVGNTKFTGAIELGDETDLKVGGNLVQPNTNKNAILGNGQLATLKVEGTTNLSSLVVNGPTTLDNTLATKITTADLVVSPGIAAFTAATASTINTSNLIVTNLARLATATATTISTGTLNSSGATKLANTSGSLTAGNSSSANVINGTTTFTGDVTISGNHKLTTYSIQNTTVTNNTANAITADFLAVGAGSSVNTTIPFVVKGDSQLTGNVTVTGPLAANGGVTIDGKTVLEDGPGWHQSYDSAGWRNQTYGGGWHMSDTSWIRSWGNKAVFMDTGFDTQAGSTSGIACSGAKGGANNYSLQVCGSIGTDILYQRDNPAYYISPAGTSRTNYILADAIHSYSYLNTSGSANIGGVLIYGTQSTGQVVMTNFFANHGYIEWASFGWGGLWGVSMWASSEKFKKNIKDIEVDTSNLYKLRPVSFDWKDKRRGTDRQIGFIAEAVDKYFPELSMKSDKGVMQSVDYGRLTIIIIAEMIKLKERVDTLANNYAEVKALKVEVSNLKNENEILINYLCKKDSEAAFCK